MVLGCEYNVFCTRLFKQFCPVIRIKKLGFKIICEVVVCAIAKFLLMKLLTGCVICLQTVLVPFCILTFTAPPGNGIYAPMNEDAKLGIPEPLRYWPAIDAFPGRLVLLRER